MNLGLLRIVKMSDIVCDLDTRARQSYGIISDLANSINEQGLIHPIVLYSPNGEAPYTLVAGARRHQACLNVLKWTEISCRIYNTLMTEHELKAIELHENLDRKDLTKDEESYLRAQLHKTLVEIHGPKIAKSPTAPGQSVSDTAKLLGVHRSTLHRDINAVKQPPFVPTSPQNLTRDEWTAYVKSGGKTDKPNPLLHDATKQQWSTNLRTVFIRIAQQLVIRAQADAPPEELRELLKLLSANIERS